MSLRKAGCPIAFAALFCFAVTSCDHSGPKSSSSITAPTETTSTVAAGTPMRLFATDRASINIQSPGKPSLKFSSPYLASIERVAQSPNPSTVIIANEGYASSLDLGTGNTKQLDLGYKPIVSPDGKWSAHISSKDDEKQHLIITNLVTGKQAVHSTPLDSSPEGDDVAISEVGWNSSSTRFAYYVSEDRGVFREGDDLTWVDPTSGAETALCKLPETWESISTMQDGSLLFSRSYDGTHDIGVSEPGKCDVKLLPKIDVDNIQAVFGTDHSHIAVRSFDDGSFVLAPDGASWKRLSDDLKYLVGYLPAA